jgi:hypothetical protein
VWPHISLVGFVIWLILVLKAYQGQMFKLPVIGVASYQNDRRGAMAAGRAFWRSTRFLLDLVDLDVIRCSLRARSGNA